jgi:hypothetical protein
VNARPILAPAALFVRSPFLDRSEIQGRAQPNT